MSVLVNKNTRLMVQGITGSEGSFHTRQMIEYGTNVVAGVTPGKGGTMFDDKVPVFNTCKEAVVNAGANTAVIFVPPAFALDAILEAADSGVNVIVTITEGIPTADMIIARNYIDDINRTGRSVRMIGPNCPGIITPGACKIGIMPGFIHLPGRVGLISRSGTLTYEAVAQLTALGLGQSTCIGIGGDPIIGTNFIDAMMLFNEDPDTDAVIMIGEIGGNAEETCAEYVKNFMTKPVVGFIAGRTAPPGRRMGHAGAIIAGGKGTAEDKIKAMRDAGIYVAESPAEMGSAVQKALEDLKAKKAAAKSSGSTAKMKTASASKPKASKKKAAKKSAPKKKTAGKKAAGKKSAGKKPAKKLLKKVKNTVSKLRKLSASAKPKAKSKVKAKVKKSKAKTKKSAGRKK
ncbi:MAG: succinate--CoA ligase subunit alpha [Ignavibacteria bacterium]|nr:succinate--CoA ligase subunit alpha [Ignavibacteria bacterium]